MGNARRILPAVLGACACLGLCAAGLAAEPPAAQIFGALPLQTDPVLSPDGRWLAWIDHGEAKPRVLMFDLEARKVQRILAVPEQTKLRNLRWHDNQTLLILLSETSEARRRTETSREYFRIIAHDVSGGDGRMLPMTRDRSGKAHSPLTALIAAHTDKPHTVIMARGPSCSRSTRATGLHRCSRSAAPSPPAGW